MSVEAEVQADPAVPVDATGQPFRLFLQIGLCADGRFQITGAIHDEVVAFGLLQKGLQTVGEFHQNARAQAMHEQAIRRLALPGGVFSGIRGAG